MVLLTGIGIAASALLLETRAEFQKLQQDQAASNAKLAAARMRLQEQQQILDRMRNDPDYVARVMRTYGYGKLDEVIFRFDSGL